MRISLAICVHEGGEEVILASSCVMGEKRICPKCVENFVSRRDRRERETHVRCQTGGQEGSRNWQKILEYGFCALASWCAIREKKKGTET